MLYGGYCSGLIIDKLEIGDSNQLLKSDASRKNYKFTYHG